MNTHEISQISPDIDYWQQENVIGAESEIDVIKSWLEFSCQNSENTYRSYVKEIKRFLIFCDSVGKSFHKITSKDLNQYYTILEFPTDDWLIPDVDMPTLKTQILTKGLNISSVGYTRKVLNIFYGYLLKSSVISVNPVSLSRKIKYEEPHNHIGKALSFDAWLELKKWLSIQVSRAKGPQERSKAIRNKWLLNLLYYSGVRRSSLIGLTMDCFKMEQRGTSRVWIMNFMMKGDRPHSIFMTDQLLEELKAYRASIGLHELPTGKETHIPVIAAISLKKNSLQNATTSISSRGVNFVIQECLSKAAADCHDHFISEELLHATTHTFRHTCATHWLTLGVDVVATKEHLGHRNINTTMVYMKNTDEHRKNEMDKLSKAFSNSGL
ncbi:tyrosine-type recombinase/integrase [Acinetobacter sp. ANC 5380]|uniref:Tyrosine-type recombinase/integrase n=1 Tax=Acinetobacter terrae TaxID=2731247 RepID=A0A7Y2RCW8_9GAMM|nr:site-specific integrase [Acinetobacter terrae]NNH76486.1 tyrosine-type recombinase/integrase [Acinetobacter terrae]